MYNPDEKLHFCFCWVDLSFILICVSQTDMWNPVFLLGNRTKEMPMKQAKNFQHMYKSVEDKKRVLKRLSKDVRLFQKQHLMSISCCSSSLCLPSLFNTIDCNFLSLYSPPPPSQKFSCGRRRLRDRALWKDAMWTRCLAKSLWRNSTDCVFHLLSVFSFPKNRWIQADL